MFKVEKGEVRICGAVPDILIDTTIMLRAVRTALKQNVGQKADILLDKAVELSKKSEEELEDETTEITKKMALDILRELFKE